MLSGTHSHSMYVSFSVSAKGNLLVRLWCLRVTQLLTPWLRWRLHWEACHPPPVTIIQLYQVVLLTETIQNLQVHLEWRIRPWIYGGTSGSVYDSGKLRAWVNNLTQGKRRIDLCVIWAEVSFWKPIWFRIGNFTQLTRDFAVNHARFACNDTNLQTSVLGFGDNFVTVEAVERFCGVLASCRA